MFTNDTSISVAKCLQGNNHSSTASALRVTNKLRPLNIKQTVIHLLCPWTKSLSTAKALNCKTEEPDFTRLLAISGSSVFDSIGLFTTATYKITMLNRLLKILAYSRVLSYMRDIVESKRFISYTNNTRNGKLLRSEYASPHLFGTEKYVHRISNR